jgi:hypothetical protein
LSGSAHSMPGSGRSSSCRSRACIGRRSEGTSVTPSA